MADTVGPALIVGVGPGIGAAVARRFAEDGAAVAVAARSRDVTESLAKELGTQGHTALALAYDAADEGAVGRALAQAKERLGPIRTLVYNVGNAVWKGIEDLTPEQFMAAMKVGPYGAFLHTRVLVPEMAAASGGNVIFTGATSSVRSPAHGPAFGAAKFALRGLAMSLSRTWTAKGVHVSHVLIDGAVGEPTGSGGATDYIAPPDIAETYLWLARQSPSAWTFELELRPAADDHLDN